MTTYWKSQDRKFCEFCKCWFADNKVSISFHENGKRHKESVKKHISQLSKKSAKEYKQNTRIENDIKKMETAAMSAYLKDVQNNADITSMNINKMLNQSGSSSNDLVISSDFAIIEPIWEEVKNDEGNSYFWNKQTNEIVKRANRPSSVKKFLSIMNILILSEHAAIRKKDNTEETQHKTVWDPPKHYLSLEEQKGNKKALEVNEKLQKKLKKQKDKAAIVEAKAHIARESMRELAVDKDKPSASAPIEFGPVPCNKPYGSWKPVEERKVEKIDLQLPKTKQVLPPVIMEPERVQFREKVVESLGDGPVEFKKRKFNNPKRNMRQKLDDE